MQFSICREPTHAPNYTRETGTALPSSKPYSSPTISLGTISGLEKAQSRRIWENFPDLLLVKVG